MRKLIGADLFTALRIVKAAGIEEEVQKIALEASDRKQLDVRRIGAEFIINAICGCGNPRAEEQIWIFLGNLMEIDAKALKAMELNDLMTKIEELMEVIQPEEIGNFFSRLSALMRTKSLR